MNWYKKLVLVSVILTLCVVVFGAYVRLTDAGLGCPDWPGCYGTLTVPESIESIENAQQAFPDSPVETDKAWIEMIHRYLAGMLGIVIFTIAFLSGWPSFFSSRLGYVDRNHASKASYRFTSFDRWHVYSWHINFYCSSALGVCQ